MLYDTRLTERYDQWTQASSVIIKCGPYSVIINDESQVCGSLEPLIKTYASTINIIAVWIICFLPEGVQYRGESVLILLFLTLAPLRNYRVDQKVFLRSKSHLGLVCFKLCLNDVLRVNYRP